jgi:hypothetical protein
MEHVEAGEVPRAKKWSRMLNVGKKRAIQQLVTLDADVTRGS